MKLSKIIAALEKDFPLSMAEPWDNPGLQVGYRNKSVKKVMIALDITDDVVEQCVQGGVDLLLTHHPLLLSGIRQINEDNISGRKVLRLASSGICHYAMHTNYDSVKMSVLAQAALKLKKTEILEVIGTTKENQLYGIGVVGELSKKSSLSELCEQVKKAFHLETVRLFGSPEAVIKKVAVCPGSGKSMIASALQKEAQVFITGDIGHHQGLDALEEGLAIIDAGHFGIEQIFMNDMVEWMTAHFEDLKVRKAVQKAPFIVI